MKNWDVGDRNAEWPNNVLSTKTVVYSDGTILPKGMPYTSSVDSGEVELCRELSTRAFEEIDYLDFDIGSEESNRLWPFFLPGVTHSEQPVVISPELIRTRFGGTVFPLATITTEPLAEEGIWWDEVTRLCITPGEPEEPALQPYRDMISWFTSQDDFIDSAFVRIGDRRLLAKIPRSQYPEGTVVVPSHLPRLCLGLTGKGSLAGLFGHTVQT